MRGTVNSDSDARALDHGDSPSFEPLIEAAMNGAIEAAATVRMSAPPNPWVGATVLDRNGESVSIGVTQQPGQPHAEVMALAAAGDRARGGTLVVTLEPCSHHGRTPPCVDAVIASGIARVVVGVQDPDTRVAGRGLAALRAAGIAVDVGLRSDAVSEQLAPYLHHRRTGRPYVVLKLAATLDGRTAAPDGTSRWITSTEARVDAHRLRAESGAIIVGAGTVRSDDPCLTVRHILGPDPLRVVLGRAPATAKVHPCIERSGELQPILEELGRNGIVQVLVEGGAHVAHSFHSNGLVDRYVLHLAPALFGGDDALAMFDGPGAPTMTQLTRGDVIDVRRLGPDLRIDLVPHTSAQPTGAT